VSRHHPWVPNGIVFAWPASLQPWGPRHREQQRDGCEGEASPRNSDSDKAKADMVAAIEKMPPEWDEVVKPAGIWCAAPRC
jgi:hypothetical protein